MIFLPAASAKKPMLSWQREVQAGASATIDGRSPFRTRSTRNRCRRVGSTYSGLKRSTVVTTAIDFAWRTASRKVGSSPVQATTVAGVATR
jgi:hypothetical protein